MFISPNFHFKSASHGQFLNLLEILYHYEFPSCVNIAIEAAIGKQAVDQIPFIATYRKKTEEGPHFKYPITRKFMFYVFFLISNDFPPLVY